MSPISQEKSISLKIYLFIFNVVQKKAQSPNQAFYFKCDLVFCPIELGYNILSHIEKKLAHWSRFKIQTIKIQKSKPLFQDGKEG